MAILRITDSEGEHVRALEGAVVTVGRGPGNHVILKDLAASSRHAQLLKDREGWLLEDRGSLNKTFVNGAQVQKVRLSPGDRILIGSTEMTFDEGPLPPQEATMPAKAQGSSGYASSFLHSIVGEASERVGARS